MAKKCPKKSVIRLQPGEQKRADWDRNHIAIKQAVLDLLREQKRAPQHTEIAERTGLTTKTVERHMRELSFDTILAGARQLGALFTEDVILGMAEAATKGSAPNARLYFQVVHGWKENEDDRGQQGTPVHHIIELVAPTTTTEGQTEQQAAKGQPANGQRDNEADATSPDAPAV